MRSTCSDMFSLSYFGKVKFFVGQFCIFLFFFSDKNEMMSKFPKWRYTVLVTEQFTFHFQRTPMVLKSGSDYVCVLFAFSRLLATGKKVRFWCSNMNRTARMLCFMVKGPSLWMKVIHYLFSAHRPPTLHSKSIKGKQQTGPMVSFNFSASYPRGGGVCWVHTNLLKRDRILCFTIQYTHCSLNLVPSHTLVSMPSMYISVHAPVWDSHV